MRRLWIQIILLFLFINIINGSIKIAKENITLTSNNDIIYVDGDNTQGPWDGTLEHPYKSINDGVKNAINGNTILVLNGTYHENVTIGLSITLKGENKSKTIIDGLY